MEKSIMEDLKGGWLNRSLHDIGMEWMVWVITNRPKTGWMNIPTNNTSWVIYGRFTRSTGAFGPKPYDKHVC